MFHLHHHPPSSVVRPRPQHHSLSFRPEPEHRFRQGFPRRAGPRHGLRERVRRQDGGGEVAEEGERCGLITAAADDDGEGDVEMVGREEGGARREERREECGK